MPIWSPLCVKLATNAGLLSKRCCFQSCSRAAQQLALSPFSQVVIRMKGYTAVCEEGEGMITERRGPPFFWSTGRRAFQGGRMSEAPFVGCSCCCCCFLDRDFSAAVTCNTYVNFMGSAAFLFKNTRLWI